MRNAKKELSLNQNEKKKLNQKIYTVFIQIKHIQFINGLMMQGFQLIDHF